MFNKKQNKTKMQDMLQMFVYLQQSKISLLKLILIFKKEIKLKKKAMSLFLNF
jgi:hypothetical protein